MEEEREQEQWQGRSKGKGATAEPRTLAADAGVRDPALSSGAPKCYLGSGESPAPVAAPLASASLLALARRRSTDPLRRRRKKRSIWTLRRRREEIYNTLFCTR